MSLQGDRAQGLCYQQGLEMVSEFQFWLASL